MKARKRPRTKPKRFRTKAEFLAAIEAIPLKFKRSGEEMSKDTREPWKTFPRNSTP